METLDHVDGLPWLAGPDQGCRKADGMERHVVLAEKLDVFDVVGVPPPSAPIAIAPRRPRPILSLPRCRRSAHRTRRKIPFVRSRRAAPGMPQARSRVMQRSFRFRGQPAPGERDHEGRPSVRAVDPRIQLDPPAATGAGNRCRLSRGLPARCRPTAPIADCDQFGGIDQAFRSRRIGRRSQVSKPQCGQVPRT